eukprot:1792266-Amphidinium_carterae.1
MTRHHDIVVRILPNLRILPSGVWKPVRVVVHASWILFQVLHAAVRTWEGYALERPGTSDPYSTRG